MQCHSTTNTNTKMQCYSTTNKNTADYNSSCYVHDLSKTTLVSICFFRTPIPREEPQESGACFLEIVFDGALQCQTSERKGNIRNHNWRILRKLQSWHCFFVFLYFVLLYFCIAHLPKDDTIFQIWWQWYLCDNLTKFCIKFVSNFNFQLW